RRPLPYVADHLPASPRAGTRRVAARRGGTEAPARGQVGARRRGLVATPGIAALDAVGRPRRRLLPLGFGRKTLARPARIGVRLVPAHVLHGLGGRHRLDAPEAGPHPPAAAVGRPELGVRRRRFFPPRPACAGPPAALV